MNKNGVKMNELITINDSDEMNVNTFDDKEIRHKIDANGNPWFVAKDVMAALGIKSQRHALRKLENDDKMEAEIPSPSGVQKYTVVSEPGLYILILQSNKDAAKRFQRWVSKEVLPSIRKTGSYSLRDMDPLDQLKMHVKIMERQRYEIKQLNSNLEKVAFEAKQENDTLTHDQISELDAIIQKRAKETGDIKDIGRMRKMLKFKYFDIPGSRTYKEIPRRVFTEAKDLVRNYVGI